jgi:hypothetical protein
MTRSAPIVRCLSSVELNPNLLADLGVYETVYLYDGSFDHFCVLIGGASLGALALHDSGHAWLSGRR